MKCEEFVGLHRAPDGDFTTGLGFKGLGLRVWGLECRVQGKTLICQSCCCCVGVCAARQQTYFGVKALR